MEHRERLLERELKLQLLHLKRARKEKAKASHRRSSLLARIRKRCFERQIRRLRHMISNPLYRKAWNMMHSRRRRFPP